MSCLPKPVLRGHLKRKGIKIIIRALVGSGLIAASINFFYKNPKIRAYEEFLKTYDPEAHEKDLKKWGYFRRIKEN